MQSAGSDYWQKGFFPVPIDPQWQKYGPMDLLTCSKVGPPATTRYSPVREETSFIKDLADWYKLGFLQSTKCGNFALPPPPTHQCPLKHLLVLLGCQIPGCVPLHATALHRAEVFPVRLQCCQRMAQGPQQALEEKAGRQVG